MHVYYVYWSQRLLQKYEKLSSDPWHLEKPERTMGTSTSTTGEEYAEVQRVFRQKLSGQCSLTSKIHGITSLKT